MRFTRPARIATSAATALAMAATLGLAAAGGASSMPSPHAWFSLDGQIDAGVMDTVEMGGVLYAGGWFTEAGGQPADDGLATFDGTTWTPMDSGPGFEVETLATDGTNLYAGGAFYDFGGGDSSPGGVAVWDGTDWTDLTGDLPAGSDITSIVLHGSDIYAFGFTYIDGDQQNPRSCLTMQFTGTLLDPAWTSIGNIQSGDCMINDAVLQGIGTQIYVVGDFTDVITGPATGFTANGVAAYDIDQQTWSGYGDGLDFGAGMGSPYSVIEGPGVGDLIVAGAFTDGTDDSPMATWNPDDEWALVPGFTGDDGVEGVKLLRDGPELYLAGYFGEWDGTTVNGIARWDFTDFYPVGTGLTYSDGTYGAVYSLALYDGLLFAFGEFDKAGSVAAAGSAYYGPAVEPGAPRSVKATATTGAATVTWAAPLSNGGVPITQYVVTAAPGGRTCTATAPTRTCTVTGLTAGSTYRFTVTAKNSIGTGPASAASAAVTIPKASSAVYRTISTRVLFYPGDSRVGPKGAAALAALKARIPAGAKVTWVKVTGYVQGTTSRFSSNDSMLAMARATSAATWLKKHAVGGGYTVGSGGVSGTTGLDRAAVVAIRYVVPAA